MTNHCTLGYSILSEYKRMDVREDSQIYFSHEASFGHLGAGGFAGGCFKKSVKNQFLTKRAFEICFYQPLKAQIACKQAASNMYTY